ncbi:hypothetical protein [Oceanicola sp. 22II-s10i]|uniref:hypothetical protein n=1 Tax=Oceanicola sp. 22II-s10i TaxID=1317116 RepID=UPI001130957B|nr:hypothetical protein [Oceanicola sp. 22II-s10i]
MFRLFRRKAAPATSERPSITLTLAFDRFEEGRNGVRLGWQATGAPEDVIFDLDFVGTPSGVTTGFLWDAQRPELENVFAVTGDTSLRIGAAFAYSEASQDVSNAVGAVWTCTPGAADVLTFNAGSAITLSLHFDPAQKSVRAV